MFHSTILIVLALVILIVLALVIMLVLTAKWDNRKTCGKNVTFSGGWKHCPKIATKEYGDYHLCSEHYEEMVEKED